MEMGILVPRARSTGLIIRDLDDEVIVYDLDRDEAHCLAPSAALVWKHCDGQTPVAEITGLLRRELGTEVGDDTVWQALTQLARYNLLEETVSRPTIGMSRRELMHKAGIAAVAAVPLITSLAVPQAAMAASGTCGTAPFGDGCTCGSGSQCRSACCYGGLCQEPGAVGKVANGFPCKGNGNCCSGNCQITAGHGEGICS